MQITTNAKLINWRKRSKDTKGKSAENITVHTEWLSEVAEKSFAPWNTKPGAYINFDKNLHLIEGGDLVAGDHVSITFLLSCGEYQGNFYTKLTGINIEKIDIQSPKSPLLSAEEEEDKPFDRDPVTKKLL